MNYKAIATCDFFLRNIDKVEGLNEDAKKQYIGEVRFLRALFYSRLVKVYGGVIITREIDVNNMNLPKSTREEVVEEVLKDLDYAAANLPNTAYSGRAVRGSALALKARVLITESRWAEAAKAAKQVIDEKKFTLCDDYAGMFNGQSQDNNPEIMFSSVYLAPDKVSHLDIMYGSWRSCSPLKGLVDAYECIDGKSIDESDLFDPQNPYKNRDPRLDLSIYLPGEPWEYGNGVVDETFLSTGFAWEKYIDRTQAPVTSTIKSAQDVIILRYADVLLMYAEAQNEAEGPDQSVYDALNAVRARVGVNMPPVLGLTKEELRERIRNERRVELPMEGIRYFDLKRWGIAHIVIPQVEDPGAKRIFEQKHYLWPFPQSEIDINDKLVQNEGY
ncbi:MULTISPECIES: RagB/SusD family nutrient uptake outer membrane protein [unclassified Carboxylicivirga]|uniref:RagB/SusD family nutrient uptake outer membrane protein n=1 Tax=Carboxylicivirga TaxID=1628153 RepID=UPI003D34DDB8